MLDWVSIRGKASLGEPNGCSPDTSSEPKAEKKSCIALALVGGAARGWAHIGVLRALDEAGIEISMIAGTSIGALVGGCYLAGKLDQRVVKLEGSLTNKLESSLPTEEEFNKTLSYMERFMRSFMDLTKDQDKDKQIENPPATPKKT